ncbi:MAG: 2-hydroxyacid dehydrogenase [Bacteriovoracaceae bacterium]
MTQKVVITRKILPIAKEMLEAEGFTVIEGNNSAMEPEELQKHLSDAKGLISMLNDSINGEILSKAPHLKVISNYAVGFDNIDVEEAKRKDIKVGNTPDVLTNATAELTLSLILSVLRNHRENFQFIKDGGWKDWMPSHLLGHELNELKVGIVGMGRIGKKTAQIIHHGFGSKIYYSHTKELSDVTEKLNATFLSIEELFETCELISFHCPLNEKTNGLVTYELLKRTPKTFYLINTARGKIIETQGLMKALDEKLITACALDVTEPEPLPVGHPLYQYSNCTILPHIGSSTFKARTLMAKRAAENIIAGLKGKELPYSVF